MGIAAAAQTIASDSAAHSFNVMSFNIRYNNTDDGVNAWPNRKALVANTIRFHQADLVGLQEALQGQMENLSRELPEFKWVGVGRDDGKTKGEYAAIMSRRERFELLERGRTTCNENCARPFRTAAAWAGVDVSWLWQSRGAHVD